jgi:hypothetical protein
MTPNLTTRLLHRLPYNEAFLREVMRKEAVAPLGVLHRATEDTELGGYNIPKVSSGINLGKAHIKIKHALFSNEYFRAGHNHDLEPVELP